MKSKKYSGCSEDFYRSQKVEFDKIMKNKSYYLIRDLPAEIASRILLPEIPRILSRQKSNGLWQNSAKVTYDILSAFKHTNVLDDLVADKKLKNVMEQVKDKQDYYSLLIKSLIFCEINEKDIHEVNKLKQRIRSTQNENGSWENTVVATVYRIEEMLNFGAAYDDQSVHRGTTFLFKHLNLKWEGLQGSGKAYGLQTRCVFSVENRNLEFEAAEKYREETVPRLICYRHLGIMQNSFCLKLLVQMGLEHDERVETALDNLYAIYNDYNSLCYFKIQKKFIARKKTN